MTIDISVQTSVYQSRTPDPDDKWDRGDESGHVTGVSARCTTDRADPISYRSHRFVCPGVEAGHLVYVVVADYESGDTFGRSGGQYDILDVLTDPHEAVALAEAARKVPNGAFNFTFGYLGQQQREYSASWTGYFERLQDVRAWPVIVE